MKLSNKETSKILRKFESEFSDKHDVKIVSTREYARDVEIIFQGIDANGRSFCKVTSIEKF